MKPGASRRVAPGESQGSNMCGETSGWFQKQTLSEEQGLFLCVDGGRAGGHLIRSICFVIHKWPDSSPSLNYLLFGQRNHLLPSSPWQRQMDVSASVSSIRFHCGRFLFSRIKSSRNRERNKRIKDKVKRRLFMVWDVKSSTNVCTFTTV